ncbi:MAG: carbamoyltransferase [Rhodospirillaceae bacterium]
MGYKTLGISSYYHDSAAALIDDDVILAAAQEERFTRVKHDSSFPAKAVEYCLTQAACKIRQLDAIVYYEAPDLKRHRQFMTYLQTAPRSLRNFMRFGRRILSGEVDIRSEIVREFDKLTEGIDISNKLRFGLHHKSHAASAFYPSPFREAAILTVDGVGEWDTTTISRGDGHEITRLDTIEFPHSLGLLYSAATSYCGFKVNDGEYKLMGLAPYGVPRYADRIKERLISVKEDGSFRLILRCFDFLTGKKMFAPAFEDVFDGPARGRDEAVTQRHMDVAASIQVVTEEVLLKLARHAVGRAGSRNLCLSGGVALNCVANGKILRSGIVDRIWIQPAAGDAGNALGCAFAHYYEHAGKREPQSPDGMRGSRLGPAFKHEDVVKELDALGAVYSVHDESELIENTVSALNDGQVIGWFDGRMEFGPRALGGRSIIADPRRIDMQRTLNLKVKNRESFRPFAPIVLLEDASSWFELEGDSPYMLIVAPVRPQHRLPQSPADAALTGIEKLRIPRTTIPAVTHVDFSARIQTVDQERSPRLYALLSAFKARTGLPMLVNTSFNVADEPIVRSPTEAYHCLVTTKIDKLVIGRCIVDRESQPAEAIERARLKSPTKPMSGAPDDLLYTMH